MAALICITNVRGTFCQLVNIANRFLRIFSNLETLIIFIFPGGAGYPYLPTQLQGMQTLGYMSVVYKHLWIVVMSIGGKNNGHNLLRFSMVVDGIKESRTHMGSTDTLLLFRQGSV